MYVIMALRSYSLKNLACVVRGPRFGVNLNVVYNVMMSKVNLQLVLQACTYHSALPSSSADTYIHLYV